MKNMFLIGDSVIVKPGHPMDPHQYNDDFSSEFMATIVSFKEKYVTVVDQDGDHWDVSYEQISSDDSYLKMQLEEHGEEYHYRKSESI